ncbi:MAG: hypothetical protein NWE76_02215, partial [Candidatus Bathyarchaeota archaeon]|nr:hypothetical protein [Candidatus Bathyarchaeota archaeon]
DQLETLPDAQRKIMEDMMSKNIPQSQEELLVEVKDKGQDGDYWKYEIWIGIDKRSEIWVAEPSKMGVSEESFQVFKNMSAFYDDLLTALRNNPMLESIGRNPFSGLAEMKGFPVKVHHLKENQVTSISAGERVDFEDGFFSPPPGYTESRPDSH